MTGGPFALAPAALLAALLPAALLAVMLVVAAICDLRARVIPNRLNLVIAATAPLAWWLGDLSLWPDIALQVGAAGALFAAFAALFFVGGIGGGDVKLIGAVALWIDVRLLPSLLFVMAIVGGVIAAVMLVRKRIAHSTEVSEVPYGVAIAAAGIWALHQQYINHLSLIPNT